MLIETWQALLVYLPHFVVFYQRNENPERGHLIAPTMKQNGSNNEIHPLHITYCLIVPRIGQQNIFKPLFKNLSRFFW